METKPTARPLLVLIADDYDGVAEMLAYLLEVTLHCETMTVVNGAEAVDAVLARRPQAVILDIDMPIMGGIEAARRIEGHLEGQRPMLIALTGGVHLSQVRDSGVFDYAFGKPPDVSMLSDILGQLIPPRTD